MADQMDGSAPGQVDRLKPHWEAFSQTQCERFALKWVDHSLRRVLASAFTRSGFEDHACSLLALPAIEDAGTLVRAEALLKQIGRTELPMQLMTPVFNFLAFIGPIGGAGDIEESCFLTVMTSRLVFGDDRLVAMMERDLVGANAGEP
ncbi:MAG: hypothetical protein ACYC8T_16100 [Myxococcaceae bacterium]